MSFYPCSNCGQRAVGKLATVYANWFNSEEQREAWRMRYCAVCLTTLMASLQAARSQESSNLTICPSCGKDSSETLSGIFLTVYPPRSDSREYALTTCLSCATSLRAAFTDHGELLRDRNAGAAAPANAGGNEWAAIPW